MEMGTLWGGDGFGKEDGDSHGYNGNYTAHTRGLRDCKTIR